MTLQSSSQHFHPNFPHHHHTTTLCSPSARFWFFFTVFEYIATLQYNCCLHHCFSCLVLVLFVWLLCGNYRGERWNGLNSSMLLLLLLLLFRQRQIDPSRMLLSLLFCLCECTWIRLLHFATIILHVLGFLFVLLLMCYYSIIIISL